MNQKPLRSLTSIVLILFFSFALVSTSFAKDVHLSAKTQSGSFTFGGLKRTFLYYIPANAKDLQRKLPLVLVLHGGSGSPEGMEKLTFNRFNELADRDGCIVVYPAGIDKNWNDGRDVPESKAFKDNIDDVGFISALIDEFIQDHNADAHRVYVTGISNGGIFSTRLACELAGKLAAAAPLSGSMPSNLPGNCSPEDPISMLFINGDADPLVPFKGGQVHFFNRKRGEVIPVMEAVRIWAKLDGCNGAPVTESLPPKDPKDPTRVDKVTYPVSKNGSEVVAYVIHGGGHTWPNGWRYLGEWAVGKVSHQLDATDVIWEFFKRHSR
jgi:polyhydroxybutyrate depolymerase